VYGHMDSFTVKRGDWVRKGQVIGYSGNTGTATTGAHLHTEAVPPGYSLNSPMLGRVNPDLYLTEWPEDINTGSLSYAGTITPLEDDMGHVDTISEEAAKRIAEHVHGLQVKREGSEGTNTLGWSLGAEALRTNGTIARTAEAAVAGVLFTKFPRQGPGQSGETDLASVISWFDHGVQNAGAANAAGQTVTIDAAQIAAAITAAVADALARGAQSIRTEGESNG